MLHNNKLNIMITHCVIEGRVVMVYQKTINLNSFIKRLVGLTFNALKHNEVHASDENQNSGLCFNEDNFVESPESEGRKFIRVEKKLHFLSKIRKTTRNHIIALYGSSWCNTPLSALRS